MCFIYFIGFLLVPVVGFILTFITQNGLFLIIGIILAIGLLVSGIRNVKNSQLIDLNEIRTNGDMDTSARSTHLEPEVYNPNQIVTRYGYEIPDISCDELPFELDHKLVTTEYITVEKLTGEVVRTSKYYLFDFDNYIILHNEITKVLDTINYKKGNLVLPGWVGVNFKLLGEISLASEDELNQLDSYENQRYLSKVPTFLFDECTNKGNKKKYPVQIYFNAYADDEINNCKNGSHGTIHYLWNGEIGKADLHFWNLRKYYGIKLKTINNDLTISRIDYNGENDEKQTIYQI